VAASFSLTGSLRVAPSWVDDLNTTALTDSATASISFALANGTGSGQANGYYKDVVTVAASGTANIDLRALPLVFMGGSGTLSLASVKALLVVNRSSTATLSVGVSVANRWTGLSAGLITVGPSGVFYTTQLTTGLATTASDKVLAITNNGASAADVEVYIVGVKT